MDPYQEYSLYDYRCAQNRPKPMNYRYNSQRNCHPGYGESVCENFDESNQFEPAQGQHLEMYKQPNFSKNFISIPKNLIKKPPDSKSNKGYEKVKKNNKSKEKFKKETNKKSMEKVKKETNSQGKDSKQNNKNKTVKQNFKKKIESTNTKIKDKKQNPKNQKVIKKQKK